MLEKCRISGFADEIDGSFDVQLSVLQELGQKYLELRGADGVGVADFTMEKAAQLKEKLDAAGIGVSAIGSPIGKIGIDDEFEHHFEKFKYIVKLAKFFDTKYIRMFSFYLPEGAKPSEYLGKVTERLKKLIDYAKQEDVVLLHENEKGIYGENAACCLDLFQELYGDHFKGIFDFANFVQCRQDTLEAYELLKPYIVYIHIKDAIWKNGEVVLPGTGDGHVEECLKKFDAAGFSGYLSLEPHLFHFAGFDSLEKGPAAEKKESNGVRAYKAAHATLQQLLHENA